MDKIKEVYSIFQDFFGDELVDLQDNNIIVLFPRTTITNEHGKSTEIGKLFAKVVVQSNGTLHGTFRLLRTEFSEKHFRAGYVHSHVPSMGREVSDIQIFRTPCLGHGPLETTCATLNVEFDPDRWNLFCYELSKYVTVESLTGGPYFRLESIGSVDHFSNSDNPWRVVHYDYFLKPVNSETEKITKRFIPYILRREVLPISYVNGIYSIALSPYELTITLSNLFIDWYNTLPNGEKPEDLYPLSTSELWFEGKCYQGKIYRRNYQYNIGDSRRTIKDYVGIPMLEFKGTSYTLEIPDLTNDTIEEEESEQTSILLTNSFAQSIVNKITKIINYGHLRNLSNNGKDLSYSTYIGEDTEIIF